MKKQWISFIAAFLTMVSLTGCGGNADNAIGTNAENNNNRFDAVDSFVSGIEETGTVADKPESESWLTLLHDSVWENGKEIRYAKYLDNDGNVVAQFRVANYECCGYVHNGMFWVENYEEDELTYYDGKTAEVLFTVEGGSAYGIDDAEYRSYSDMNRFGYAVIHAELEGKRYAGVIIDRNGNYVDFSLIGFDDAYKKNDYEFMYLNERIAFLDVTRGDDAVCTVNWEDHTLTRIEVPEDAEDEFDWIRHMTSRQVSCNAEYVIDCDRDAGEIDVYDRYYENIVLSLQDIPEFAPYSVFFARFLSWNENYIIVTLKDAERKDYYSILDTEGNICMQPTAEIKGYMDYTEPFGTHGWFSGEMINMEKDILSDDLIPVRDRHYEYGYIDICGNWIIEPQFESAEPFRNGFARVDESRYIDVHGNIVEE